MRMTIDTAITVLGMVEAHGICIEAKDIAVDTMRKYQMMQADYENRLKADMVTMLEELKLEFEKYESKWAENEDQILASIRTWDDFDDIIQQKIDALKAGEQQGENEQQ